MRRFSLGLVALAVVLSAAPQAFAQRGQGRGFGGFGPGSLMLLNQKSVQEELKLSDDQVAKVETEAEKQRASFAELRDLGQEERRTKLQEQFKANDATIAGILKEDQLKRLKQIALQQRTAAGLTDPEVAQALSLTSEQKEQVESIERTAQEERRSLFQGGGGGDREEARKKLDANRAATTEKALGLLTAEQKEKWKTLVGEPFKGEIRAGFRGRGNRPGGASRALRGDQRAMSPVAAGLLALTGYLGDDEKQPPRADHRHRRGDEARRHRPHRPSAGVRDQGPGARDQPGRGWGDRGPRGRQHHFAHAPGHRPHGPAHHRDFQARHHGHRPFAHHAPRPGFGTWRGHGPAHHHGHHFAAGHHRHRGGFHHHRQWGHHDRGHHGWDHRGWAHHGPPHHFASWHHHHTQHFGPPHARPGDRPHPPRRPDHDRRDHRGGADAGPTDAAIQLARLQRQFDTLAQEIATLQRELHR